jgi:hypothetical protein
MMISCEKSEMSWKTGKRENRNVVTWLCLLSSAAFGLCFCFQIFEIETENLFVLDFQTTPSYGRKLYETHRILSQ